MRLKSRTRWVPGGFQVLIPQAGMKKPFSGSFSDAVRFLYSFRSKNHALVEKHGWSLDISDIERDVELYNAQRMVAAGYLNFVELEGEAAVQKKILQEPIGKTGRLFQNVGNAVGKVKTALAIYRDLFGPEGKVVAKEEAERRASICSVCPRNDLAGGLTKYFLKEAASEIMMVAGMLKKRNVSTSLDDKLGVCQICLCPLGAKIHVESEILKKHIKSDEIAKLPSNCWIPPAVA